MSELGRGAVEALKCLHDKGVRYSTYIDVGCADGSFFLIGHSVGFFRSSVPMHIDANPLYEPSLKSIKEVIGGDYAICAASDADGELQLTVSKNPYWTSAREEDDLYWKRLNEKSLSKTIVPASTLDTIQKKFSLRPPYFLRLDVQGSELSALKGAKNLLKKTHVVLCECDIDDFSSIHAFLDRNHFRLFDIPTLHYVGDGELGWFYAIYVSDQASFVLPKNFWRAEQTDDVMRLQAQHRQIVLESNKNYLDQIRANPISRNGKCPCGSGKKYKHCCGV